MTGAHIHSHSDRTSVPPKADVRAATVVSPAAVAATLSNSGPLHGARSALASSPPNDNELAPGDLANAGGDHEVAPSTAHPFEVSSLTSAASSGVAAFSDCIGDIDPELEAEIQRLERDWLRAGIVMNAATLATIAASESFSNSTSLVKA